MLDLLCIHQHLACLKLRYLDLVLLLLLCKFFLIHLLLLLLLLLCLQDLLYEILFLKLFGLVKHVHTQAES